jgi:hypothetical protein
MSILEDRIAILAEKFPFVPRDQIEKRAREDLLREIRKTASSGTKKFRIVTREDLVRKYLGHLHIPICQFILEAMNNPWEHAETCEES